MSTTTLEHPLLTEAELREVTDFVYREARLADEASSSDART